MNNPKFKVGDTVVVFKKFESIWWVSTMDSFVMPYRFSYDYIYKVEEVKKNYNKFVYALSSFIQYDDGNISKQKFRFWFPEDSLTSLEDFKHQENCEDIIYFN